MNQWDPVQQEKIEQVAGKYNISVDRAKSIVDFYLKSDVKHVRKYEPMVMVNVGFWYLDPHKTNGKIRRLILKFRNGGMTEAELRKELATWLPLHRIANTHMPLTGKRYRYNMIKFGSDWGIYRKNVPGFVWNPKAKQQPVKKHSNV